MEKTRIIDALVDEAFLDLEKAFDRVSQSQIKKALIRESIGN